MANNPFNRRTFLANGVSVFGTAMLMSDPLRLIASGTQANGMTVGQIMDQFIKEVPNAPFANTVDTLKSGNRDSSMKYFVSIRIFCHELISG
jgi:hypothetical protein